MISAAAGHFSAGGMEEADGADRHAAVWLGGQDAPIDVRGVRRVVRVPVAPKMILTGSAAFVESVVDRTW